ncbi:MAG: hypothetical protein IKN45_05055, partial [Lachnospiraceae bacterium]|nr:hypothetical protein [Lachnospiraceae bacterium]
MKKKTGLIIGGVAGGLLVIAGLIAGLFFLKGHKNESYRVIKVMNVLSVVRQFETDGELECDTTGGDAELGLG